MIEEFTLKVSKGIHGLWYVTSPEIHGFMAAGASLGEVLGNIEQSMHELREAKARQEDLPKTSTASHYS